MGAVINIIDRLREYADDKGMDPIFLTRTDAKEIIEAIDELSESFVVVANGLHEEQKG